MAEIINLNRARKQRVREADKLRAATNRAAHGRTRAEREAAASERDRAGRALDGHRRDDPAED